MCKNNLACSSYQSVHTSAVRSSRYKARGKFGEHERCVRVFLSPLQTSRVLHISMNAQLTHEPIVIKHFQPDGIFFLEGFVCGRHERAQ